MPATPADGLPPRAPATPPDTPSRPARTPTTLRGRRRRGLAALAAAALLAPGCTYDSEITARRPLPPLLVKTEPRVEDPDVPRRREHEVRLTREAGLDVLRVEERELADFVTVRIEQPRTEVVHHASVNDLGAWWILPMTADLTHAMWVKERPAGQGGRGLGTLIGWCIGVPITIALDAVFGIPHILRMVANELDDVELGSPQDASLRETGVVVERRELVAHLADPRILVDDRAWLAPRLGEDGALRFDASLVAPLDESPLPALRLVGQVDGRQLTVPLPWPAGWREAVRAERDYDASDDPTALGGRGRASARAPSRITPGVPATLSVIVTAEGGGDLCGLVAETHSDNPWLAGRQLSFGRLSPGQSARLDVELLLPEEPPGGREHLRVRFRTTRGVAPDEIRLELRTGVAAPAR